MFLFPDLQQHINFNCTKYLITISLSGVQLGGEGERPPLPSFENQKKYPDLRKKCPVCVHP